MYRYFLALRYLLSRPINLLGTAGVMLGVWALIVVVSIFTGYLETARHHVIGSTSDLSALRLPAGVPFEALARSLQKDPDVVAVAPRVVWYGLLHAVNEDQAPQRGTASDSAHGVPGADANFVTVIGIDPAAEAHVSAFGAWLRAVPEPALRVADADLPFARGALVVSRARALQHGIAAGDAVALASAVRRTGGGPQEESLDLVEKELVVAGCFESALVLFDGITVLADLTVMRDLLGHADRPGFVTEVAIKVREPARAEEVGWRLERVLRRDHGEGILVRTAEALNEGALLNIDHQRSLMALVLFVITIVATFLVYATLSMMVTEKTRDIGILTALGATPRGVMVVFLACGTGVSLLGVILGVVTGCLSALYTDAFNTWMRGTFGLDLFPTRVYGLAHVPVALEPGWILLVVAIAIGLGLVVSGVPAWRAARHDPLQSLRNE